MLGRVIMLNCMVGVRAINSTHRVSRVFRYSSTGFTMRSFHSYAIIVLLVFGWSGVVHAAIDEANNGPRAVVEHAANKVIEILDNERESIRNNPDQIYDLVDEHILPNFDFDKMSLFVLGKVWKQATQEQKTRFQREFTRLLINTYTTALLEYSTDEPITYKDVKLSAKNKNVAIVPTEVRQKGTGPIDVTYRMFKNDNGWRIYDVIIDGVSLVTNYRANFASLLRSEGLDGLIANLSEHNHPKDIVTSKSEPVAQ